MTLKTGQMVNNRYCILLKLSEGGFGVIYLALDDTADAASAQRLVVIKESKSDDVDVHNSLLEEIKLLSRLQHPNLPRIYDYFYTDDHRLCIVMEYILGNNLEYFYHHNELPDVETTVAWITQVLEVLALMHTQSPPIIHRDVKLGNIQIHSVTRQAYLLDFGIAKNGPYTRLLAGTPPYAPWEQHRSGLTTPATDTYAVGVCLYMLLTGNEPEESARGKEALIPSYHNPSLPAELDAIVMKATQWQPESRYADAQAMLVDLEQVRFAQPFLKQVVEKQSNRIIELEKQFEATHAERTRQEVWITELEEQLGSTRAESIRQHALITELEAAYTSISEELNARVDSQQCINDELATQEVRQEDLIPEQDEAQASPSSLTVVDEVPSIEITRWQNQIRQLETASAEANHTILTLIVRYPLFLEGWLIVIALSIFMWLLPVSQGFRVFSILFADSLYLPISLAVAALSAIRRSGWRWHRNVLLLCVLGISYVAVCALTAISIAGLAGYQPSGEHLVLMAVGVLVVGLFCSLPVAGWKLDPF